jgi:hypothetical protein
MPDTRFMQGRRFHVQCKLPNLALVLHTDSLPCGRVRYQCVACNEESGEVDMYLEVDGSVRTAQVGEFFAKLVGEGLRCYPLRTHRQSRRVWAFIRSMDTRAVTETGEHDFCAVEEEVAPAKTADSRLVAERDELTRRVAATERMLQPPPALDVGIAFVLNAERCKASVYAEEYWRKRLHLCEKDIAELRMEKGATPKEAAESARNAFGDLKQQVSAMDGLLNERSFTLFDLRHIFDLHRAQLEKIGVHVGTWQDWTVPACDVKAHREVAALRLRLLQLEKMEQRAVCSRTDVDHNAELARARGSAPSTLAVAMRAACLRAEMELDEARKEYGAVDALYSQDGLKAVLLDLQVRLGCMDVQVRRAAETCILFGRTAISRRHG